MNWFIVLLFWNPALQDFDVANGWAPIPMATRAACDKRVEYVEQYLPSEKPDIEHIVGCVFAISMANAIQIMKDSE